MRLGRRLRMTRLWFPAENAHSHRREKQDRTTQYAILYIAMRRVGCVVWCGVVWCEGEGWKVVVEGVEAEGKRKKAKKAESKTPRKGALRNGGMLPSSLRSAGSPRTPPHRKGQGRLIGTLGCTYAPRDLIAFLPRALGFAHRRIDASNPSNDTSERRSYLYGPRNRVCGDSRKDGKTSG